MENEFYKQAILCLMFAMAEADGKFNDTELIEVITMKNVFSEYAEHDIMALHREYQTRFQDKGFAEICNIMVRQIPQELHMATLSLLADVAVADFDVDLQESSLISLAANAMNINEAAVKTLLLASLSKKLMLNIGKE